MLGASKHFLAAPFELEVEFGGHGFPTQLPEDAGDLRIKGLSSEKLEATTIGVIATDAILNKGQAKRLAISAHDGYARAIWPVHTPMDGDLVFALATGEKPAPSDRIDMVALYAAAASTMARAIARAIYEARAAAGDLLPSWQTSYGIEE